MFKNTANLLSLQNLIKRDPQSYLEEYRQQARHFQANLAIFHTAQLHASSNAAATGAVGAGELGNVGGLASQTGSGGTKSHKFHKDFGALVSFLSHVSPCFPAEGGAFTTALLTLLKDNHAALDPPLRKTVVSAAILLQNRGMVERMTLLPILFHLFSLQDKQLRTLLFNHIVSDIKRINLKRVPGYLKVNTQLQNYMYTMLSDKTSPLAAKKSLDVMVDLWRRKIWNDEKTVHAIQNACFSKDTRIKVVALRFFLGMTFYEEEEEEEEEEEKQTIRAKLSVTKTSMKGVVKHRKKREREIRRAQKKVNREDGEKGHSSVIDDCPAIFLLHDPQTFAERLFSMLRKSNESFQVRMLMMNVISRLIGSHKLLLLNFYPFLQKYLQPHQKNVTHILTYLAQASHPIVPPDVLQPVIRTLANHFVTDRSAPEVTAVGLNAIREICARAPLVMEGDLLWDLVQYKKDKNKGVMMASRSLIALFRDLNPMLLARKERGKYAAEVTEDDVQYGNFEKVRTDIVGADLLASINSTTDDGDSSSKPKRALSNEDDWDLPQAASDSDSGEESDEDLGTNTKEINAYLRAIEKKRSKKDGEESEEESEEEEDEDMVEMTLSDLEALPDAEESNDEDADSDEEEEEDGEEEDGEDEEMEDDEEDDEEEEEEEESAPASKKQRTSTGSVARKTKTSAADAEESKESTPAQPSLPLGATRIFTPKDFEAMRQARLAAAMDGNKRAKRQREDGSTLLNLGSDVKQRDRKDLVGEVVDEDSIIGWKAKQRKSKEERLASIYEGREGGVNSKKKGGGSTNEDKEKAKPFQLVKHSQKVQRKKQRSFSQQQQAFAGHIKTMKLMGKKTKNKMKKRKSSKNMGNK